MAQQLLPGVPKELVISQSQRMTESYTYINKEHFLESDTKTERSILEQYIKEI